MTEIWTAGETFETPVSYTIKYGDNYEEFDSPITADDVINFAKRVGLSAFQVRASNGRLLSRGDFPHAGNVILEKVTKVG